MDLYPFKICGSEYDMYYIQKKWMTYCCSLNETHLSSGLSLKLHSEALGPSSSAHGCDVNSKKKVSRTLFTCVEGVCVLLVYTEHFFLDLMGKK